MRKIALSLAFLTAPALAQSATVPSWDVPAKVPTDRVITIKAPTDRVITIYETDKNGIAVEIFRMDAGGCLRGPIVFTEIDGKEIFRLLPDIEYPTDCGHKIQR